MNPTGWSTQWTGELNKPKKRGKSHGRTAPRAGGAIDYAGEARGPADAHVAEPGGIPRRIRGTQAVAEKGAQGQDRDGRGQSAARDFHRQEIHESRPLVPRSHPGRQHGPDEGGGEIRVSARLQIFHLRHVVDSAGDHPLHRRPGAHHPHPGAHDRDDQQADAGAEAARAGLRARTHAGGSRGRNPASRRARARGAQDGAAAHLAPVPRGRRATTPALAISSRTKARKTPAT